MGYLYKCSHCKFNTDKKKSLSQHLRNAKCKGVLNDAMASIIIKRRNSVQRRREKVFQRKEEGMDIVEEGEHMNVFEEETCKTPDIDLNEALPFAPSPSPQAAFPRTRSPSTRPSGRPNRKARLPARYNDYTDALPPPPPPIIPEIDRISSPISSPTVDSPDNSGSNVYKTPANTFGVYYTYNGGAPSYTPDGLESADRHADSPNFTTEAASEPSDNWWSCFGSSVRSLQQSYFTPFLNATSFRLMNWFYGSSTSKSLTELDRLVQDVLLADDFCQDDLKGFRATRENQRLDEWMDELDSPFAPEDGWKETSVDIPIPCEGKTYHSVDSIPTYSAPGLFYRRPMEVIKAALAEPSAQQFHLTPHQAHWSPSPDKPSERLYSEIYSADAFISEHESIKSQPRENNCQLETVVLSLMFWSDATQLTHFGDTSLWPIYLFFGNISKYIWGKPSSFSSHHLAYIPKLSDSFKDDYYGVHKKFPSSEIITICRKALVHAVWLLLMDKEFVNVYKNGFKVRFFDGVLRRVFLRISIYGMDYPEKVLMALIRHIGNFPCPRCLVPKSLIRWLGTTPDDKIQMEKKRVDDKKRCSLVKKAWTLIYLKGTKITSQHVERLLFPTSLLPVQNAFSIRLSDLGFDFHDMIAPDLLHEFELGVWKRTFIHFMRILETLGDGKIERLNKRYRSMPTYGNGVIQKFRNDPSAMKKLAGRDYEDLLQCALPVFEGLLPAPHDDLVCKLIFELATWHSLAKLRLHSESTLKSLEGSARRLGQLYRRFVSETCGSYEARELPAETAVRGRRVAQSQSQSAQAAQPLVPKMIKFQLNTYKYHSLGDYPAYIRKYGTTDNYSTQIGEVEHKRVKKFYPRAQKRQYVKGIAQQQHREHLLHLISQSDPYLPKPTRSDAIPDTHEKTVTEVLPAVSPHEQHQMSLDTQKSGKLNIYQWLGERESDPALSDFLPRLRRHLFMQLIGYATNRDEDEITVDEANTIHIINDLIYSHERLRINYTTYDLRRTQDSINPKTHSDIMVLSPEEDDGTTRFHPYWYARVIKIFHAQVYFRGSRSYPQIPSGNRIMKFLFVRWFSNETLHEYGWRNKHLPMVNFSSIDGPEPFGFVNPRHVLRASHIVPAFKFGQTSELLPPSLARLSKEANKDWSFYYVNIFVDRDMMMRYRGGGVGHKSTRYATDKFLDDRDPFDEITVWSEPEQNPALLQPVPEMISNEGDEDTNGLRDTDSDLGEEELDRVDDEDIDGRLSLEEELGFSPL